MFGFFKKKTPPTALDAFIRLAYGDNPPAKAANLVDACHIAHRQLLFREVSEVEVQTLAQSLFNGPVPYSTHDLAVSVALNCFKRPELSNQLKGSVFAARLNVANWARERKVVAPLAQSFDAVLSRLYQDKGDAERTADDRQTIRPTADNEVEMGEKYRVFRENNKGASIQTAARAVKAFMAWQHNNLQAKKLELDLLDNDDTVEEQIIERSFMLGASMAAIYAFSLPRDQGDLFLMNVVGMYHGISDHDQVNHEVKIMVDAANDLKDASEAGTVLMIDFLVNGKQERDQYGLATLIGIKPDQGDVMT